MPSKLGQWMKDVMLQNQGMKVLTLALAILTFYAIRNATNDLNTYVVPVVARV